MLVAYVVTSILFGPAINWNNDNGGNEVEDKAAGWLLVSLVMVGAAVTLSLLSLGFMISYAEVLIQATLIGSIVTTALASALFFVEGLMGAGLIWMFFALISACYAYFVWNRIPFAAATLKTGLAAVKSNLGIMNVAIASLGVAVLWTFWWVTNYIGVSTHLANNGGDDGDVASMDGGITFILLVCFYWAHQVISSVVHVTTAGTVGTWWFEPQHANGCCSEAVQGSARRAVTTSLGSICFGSLLVALIQALRAMVHQARQADDGIVVCIADCLLGIIEAIAEYFNRWAFIYVGLYGYSFMEAGSNVMTLFKSRGWTVIITDDLVSNVLTFMALAVGAVTGAIGLIAYKINPNWFEDQDDNTNLMWAVFVLGIIIGAGFSSIMLSVVQSAVDSTIVCFAEAPLDLQKNHLAHFEELNGTWSELYPRLWTEGDGGEEEKNRREEEARV